MSLTENSQKIILDLCGGTGAWSKPYRDNGYDVRLITLPDYDVRYYQPPSNVYGILAAPPCNEFSFARTNRPIPTDFRSGLEIVYACRRIIDEAICLQWDNHTIFNFKFWVLENPRGYLTRFLGKPIFEFDPSDFGDMYNKRTYLWGYFNIPKKKGKGLVIPNYIQKMPPSQNRSELRAVTPPGFARAFYEANK